MEEGVKCRNKVFTASCCFKQTMHQIVESAQTTDDVPPMSRNSSHNQSNSQTTTHMYMNAVSMEKIVPDDITQHILSQRVPTLADELAFARLIENIEGPYIKACF